MRRKGGYAGRGYSSNTNGLFAPLTIIAAGGKPTFEHQADIKLIIPAASSGTVITKPSLTGDSSVSVKASISPDTANTDENGVVMFTLTSSDIIQSGVTVNYQGVTAQVTQAWDNVAGGDWNFDPYFNFDTGNPIAFAPQFLDDRNAPVPITTHSITFEVTALDVWVMQADGSYYLVTGADPSSFPGLAVFTPATVNDYRNLGVYSSSLNITFDEYNMLDTVYFDASDNVTYTP